MDKPKTSPVAFMAWAVPIGGGFAWAAANFETVEPMLKSVIGVFVALFAMLGLGFTACYFLLYRPAIAGRADRYAKLDAAVAHAAECDIKLARLEERVSVMEEYRPIARKAGDAA